MSKEVFRTFIFLVIYLLISCDQTSPVLPDEKDILDGPIEGLTPSEHISFIKGDNAFNEVFTVTKGLGPIFVSNACSGCHPGDGKGSPFVGFIRFGQADTLGNNFIDQGGPQLQQKAIPGYTPEKLPPDVTFTKLLAPAVTGLGFLEAVNDETLLDIADPYDNDGDGISGRVHWNFIPEYILPRPNGQKKNGKYITRFGKKGAIYDLLQQTAGAYNEDMGITSVFEPVDPFSGLEEDPEVSINSINDVVFYLKTLKAPIARDQDSPDVLAGKQLFNELQCSACHIPTLKTGFSPIESLLFKEIRPYTDLLLHDMGPELDDGYTEGFALSSEWRTPPLWGLGLSKNAQGGEFFLLHDGRAKSIEEAILYHGGEAEDIKQRFFQLKDSDKKLVIAFLESL